MTSIAYHAGAIIISIVVAAVVGAVLGFPSPLGLITAIRDVLPAAVQWYEPVLAQVCVAVAFVLSLAVFYK